MIGKCNKCNIEKELAKGKNSCKECKNKYENLRRNLQSDDKKEESNKKERERYAKKKENIQEVILDENKELKCTVCCTTKTLDKFYVAKCKGTIRPMCKECCLIKKKEYYQANRKQCIEQNTKYQINKIKTNPQFKLEVRLRNRTYHAFKSQGESKTKRTMKYLDCTKEFLHKWIQFLLDKQDEKIMTPDNYGPTLCEAH